MMNISAYLYKPAMLCLLLASITIITYLPLHNNGFIEIYDDYEYVVENEYVNSGISFSNIRWAFFSFHSANWHPLTWISHMLDCQLYGLQPGGHHLSNLIIHTLNVLLLFMFLSTATGATVRSCLVALLFAIHPVHVEPVAWIAERKELLSTFFGLASCIAYTGYIKSSRKFPYVASILFFMFALMSKAMLVTLPFLLLLFDLWPLKRVAIDGLKHSGPGTRTISPAKCIVEKIPYFVFSAFSSIITLVSQGQSRAIAPAEHLPILTRCAHAVTSYARYLYTLAWPLKLAVFYPHEGMPSPAMLVSSIVLLTIITTISILSFKKHPWIFTGWFWYLGTLVPVIGIIQVGGQAFADRYAYVPAIGIYIIFFWTIYLLYHKNKYFQRLLLPLGAAICLILAIQTRRQLSFWKNSITLFEHAVEVTENNYFAHYNLGLSHSFNQEYQKAAQYYTLSIQIKPTLDAINNLGVAHLNMGNYSRAVKVFEKLLALDSTYIEGYYNIGNAYYYRGMHDSAKVFFRKTLTRSPTYYKALNNLGVIYLGEKKYPAAIACFNKSLKLNPSDYRTYLKRAAAFALSGDMRASLDDYKKVSKKYPHDPRLHFEIGKLYEKLGKNDSAAAHYEAARTTAPENQSFSKTQ
ncbi:MAG: tetratricopeptide repeat protein [Chitinivibrionales bacterium]|nr:tetratricopeptide repeat protein [Chitinivibrionales bacterium]